jgi:hypothetical protein
MPIIVFYDVNEAEYWWFGTTAAYGEANSILKQQARTGSSVLLVKP